MQVQCEGQGGARLFYVKQMFGYHKTGWRGLAKNENRLALLLGSQSCGV